MVFLPKPGLTLVAVCRNGESQAQLKQQLEFLHGQMLFLLTNKVNTVAAIAYRPPDPFPHSPSQRYWTAPASTFAACWVVHPAYSRASFVAQAGACPCCLVRYQSSLCLGHPGPEPLRP